MILVIYNHISETTRRVPIHSYADIERLAQTYPVIHHLEKKTSNPLQLLRYLVQYLSTGVHDAHLEDDGYQIKTKQQHRADLISKQLRNQKAKIPGQLKKSDKIGGDQQGIVSQVKPESGQMGITKAPEKPTPYGRRFTFSPASEAGEDSVKTLDPSKLDEVTSKQINNEYWQHTGKQGNHTFHFLSRNADPSQKAIAGIMTASHEGKQHLRAAFSESTKDEHLDFLRQQIHANPDHTYDEPLAIDSKKHMAEGWENHHPDLVHGLVPDKTLQAPPNTISSWISFAGVNGDTTPRVITKEALRHFERREKRRKADENRIDSRRISYFDDPNFTTAHREAVYGKVANDIFGLGEYIPKTTVFNHPLSNRPWSAMEFIKGAQPVTRESRKDDLKQITENGDIYKLALMNMILGNNDRHLNNMLKDPSGRLHLIDHGLTFDYNGITTGLIPQYVDDPDHDYSLLDEAVPESVHKWLWDIDVPKMAQQLHAMKVPEDIIMNAVKRMGDARRWSNMLRHEKKENPEMHLGLRHLADLIRARKLDTDPDSLDRASEAFRKRILNNVKRPLAVVGNRNISKMSRTRHADDADKTRPMTTKDIPTVQDAATIAQDQAHVEILPDGRTVIRHPENEARHGIDKELNSGDDETERDV